MERLFRAALAPQYAGPVLALLMFAYYGIAVIANPSFSDDMRASRLVAGLSTVSALGLLCGWAFAPGSAHRHHAPANPRPIVMGIGVPFIVFIAITIISAPGVPLLAALSGQDVLDIAVSRENFLKAREGVFALLPYINGLLTFTFVPYAMCLGILSRMRAGWVLAAVFLGYSLLFVEKAFFVRVLAPLGALLVVSHYRKVRLSWLLAGALAVLVTNIQLSGFTNEERDIIEFFIYRLLEVPAQTAIDTLSFWQQTWHGELLGGATNLVFSQLFGLDRILLERLVFEYQFGAFETGTGSSNSVFFIDAYVNFGWLGVMVTSLLAGAVLKLVGQSADLALRCLAPLLVYALFFGSFYSTMFGNGVLLFLTILVFVRYRPVQASPSNPWSAQGA